MKISGDKDLFPLFPSCYNCSNNRSFPLRKKFPDLFESNLRNSFMRLARRTMKLWQRIREWEIGSISRLQEQSGLIDYPENYV